MKLHDFVDHSYQMFLNQMQDARIILLHPDSRYRSMLVARLINDPDLRVFYYAMGPDDINLLAFITSITHDLADQHPTFGRHTNMLPQNVYENPEDHFDVVLDTFARDLVEISDEPFLLVLDEYDRSDTSDAVQRFVERLSYLLPLRCKIVLNSRTLPRLPWVAMMAHRRAVILRDDEVIIEDIYGKRPEGDGGLEVYALGPGFVLKQGKTIDNWEGHLPRLLFFFALDCPIVTRSDICNAFWPELESDQAVNVFHVTKRRLHKALDSDVLVHGDGYYQINPEMPIYYDAMEFTTALMRGRNAGDLESRMAAWQRAVEIYRGPFLQGHDDPWILERREEFTAGYLEALIEMASVWIQRGRHEQALTLYQKALLADNLREDLHCDVMRLYVQLGRRSEAVAHYQRLVESFQDMDRELSAETQRLYNEISA